MGQGPSVEKHRFRHITDPNISVNIQCPPLIRSWIIESAAYCNQILLVPLYITSTQKTSVNCGSFG